jgi:hypothetical protein
MTLFIVPMTVLAVTAILCLAALRAWRGWLELKRLELAQPAAPRGDDTATRIELADVRERLKKLEAIASDVEL